ncbi:MAG TPA: PQQ-dependent sugar dehydrogenase [Baekduia sp.]|uniref:PQQ-dependent sugar dehydrogenase n=1 Tax=Baekduia sp. TaxID=2600305 RepID=UPI002C1BDDF3|nr:PQQ-dependent sugar dehydrogenase [Baekduia sp.]HMJ32370.1 PQQ-dependent sugar dehydrogenase [Baekduia sp.]
MLHPALPSAALLAAVALVACGSDGDRAGAQTGDHAAAPAAQAPASTDLRTATDPGPGAQAAAGRGVRLVKVGDFTQPLYVTAPPGDRRRVFVVEQPGRIRLVRGGKQAGTFLDVRDQVTAGGEQGLLGLAFGPDYATSGLFYIYFTGTDAKERLVEYRRRTDDVADPASARTLFVHDDPEPNHNGGQLAFGPDGLLYVGTGDGGGGNDQHGSRGNAQDLASPLGKILRIDPRAADGKPFSAPPSNPFVGVAGARPEIYAYGLRNPWRFSFDRVRGDLAIGDVGQDAVEEIDFVRKGKGRGANFGWRPFEGRNRLFDERAPGAIGPVLTKTHDDGWCSITGGYVVRDKGVPGLLGRYVYGDFCKGELRSARLSAGRAADDRPIAGLDTVSGLDSFGEDAAGRVYVVSQSGPVYRFAAR